MFKCRPVSPMYWGLKIDTDGGGDATDTEVTLEDGRVIDIVWADQELDTDAADASVAADDYVVWEAMDGADAVHSPNYQFITKEAFATDFLVVG